MEDAAAPVTYLLVDGELRRHARRQRPRAAVFRQSAETVTALLAAGADPDIGSPSAREVATCFELPQMAALLGPSG